MQQKTSFFSKTVFLKNITHYWPVWAAYLVVCLLRLPISLYSRLNSVDASSAVANTEDSLIAILQDTVQGALQPFAVFLFACITGIALFSYLYQARSAYMLHALPVCRESLYITNVLSGICFLVIPQIVAFLAGIFVCFLHHVTHLEYLMHWLLLSTGMVIFAFALTLLVVMITGNIVAAPVFFFLINYLYVGCRTIVAWFVEVLCYGITDACFTFGDFLSPYYFLSHRFSGFFSTLFMGMKKELSLPETYLFIGGYFAASIPLFVLAFVLYKRKHLETTGDILTVPCLKPVFRWVLTFCFSSVATIWAHTLFSAGSKTRSGLLPITIFMAVGCVIFFFLSDMILQKRFFVFCRRKFAECGILAALFLALLISIDCNLFGSETRIPPKDKIESIFLDGNYPIDVDKDDFEKVVAIHKSLVDSKKEIQSYFQKYSSNPSYTSLELKYTLKSGSVISRTYQIPVEEYYLEKTDYALNQIEELSSNPEYYLRYHFTDAYESITFMDGSLDVYNGSEYLENVTLDQAQCNRIYEAFKQDIREGNYRIYGYYSFSSLGDKIFYNSLYFSYYAPLGTSYVSHAGNNTINTGDALQGTNITLTADCVHTLEVLRELGIIGENRGMITQKDADMMYDDSKYKDVEIYH